jgi:hypothetical protein
VELNNSNSYFPATSTVEHFLAVSPLPPFAETMQNRWSSILSQVRLPAIRWGGMPKLNCWKIALVHLELDCEEIRTSGALSPGLPRGPRGLAYASRCDLNLKVETPPQAFSKALMHLSSKWRIACHQNTPLRLSAAVVQLMQNRSTHPILNEYQYLAQMQYGQSLIDQMKETLTNSQAHMNLLVHQYEFPTARAANFLFLITPYF